METYIDTTFELIIHLMFNQKLSYRNHAFSFNYILEKFALN
jgi:hypothetical protein